MRIVLAAVALAAVQLGPTSPYSTSSNTVVGAPDFSHERIAAAVAPIAERALQEQGIVGFSVGIAQRGRPVYLAGFGMADLERQRRSTEDTQYEIASISKMFTAVAILQLVDNGLIDLDTPVSTYLSNYQGPLRDTPVRALLNHTSGFRDGPFDIAGARLQSAHPRTTEEMLASPEHAQGILVGPAGEDFRYSNAAFMLAALIIEEVGGKTYSEVIHEQILGPVGMSHSAAGELFGGSRSSINYMRVEARPVPTPNFQLSFWDGAGSLASPTSDLLAFQAALDEGRLLTPASMRLLQEPTIVTIGVERVRVPYGLGIRHGPAGGRRKLGHTGTWSGSAVLAHYPDDEVTIVVLTNTNTQTQLFVTDPLASDAVHASELESWIAHALFGDESPVFSSNPIPFDAEFADALTGRYRIGDSFYDHRWEEGELRVYRAETSEMRGRLLRVGPLATVYVPGDGELPITLAGGRMSNPPYEIDEWDPAGNWVLMYMPGGMFSNIARRVGPSD